METITLIWVAASVTLVLWLGIEFYAYLTGRRLITYHLRRAPKAIVFLLGFGIGALFGHFWW